MSIMVAISPYSTQTCSERGIHTMKTNLSKLGNSLPKKVASTLVVRLATIKFRLLPTVARSPNRRGYNNIKGMIAPSLQQIKVRALELAIKIINKMLFMRSHPSGLKYTSSSF